MAEGVALCVIGRQVVSTFPTPKATGENHQCLYDEIAALTQFPITSRATLVKVGDWKMEILK
jgi:hypothetical protein